MYLRMLDMRSFYLEKTKSLMTVLYFSLVTKVGVKGR